MGIGFLTWVCKSIKTKMKKIVCFISACLVFTAVHAQTSTTTTVTTTTTTEPSTNVAVSDNNQDNDRPKKDFELRRGYIGGRALATLSSWKVRDLDNSTVAAD